MNTPTDSLSCEEMAAMRAKYPDLDSYEAWKRSGCPIPATNWPDDPPKQKPAQSEQHTPLFHPANTTALSADMVLALSGRGRASGGGGGRGSMNVLNRQSRKSNGRYRDGQ